MSAKKKDKNESADKIGPKSINVTVLTGMQIGGTNQTMVPWDVNGRLMLVQALFQLPADVKAGQALTELPVTINGPPQPLSVSILVQKGMKIGARNTTLLPGLVTDKLIPIAYDLPAEAKIGQKIRLRCEQTGPAEDIPPPILPPTPVSEEALGSWFRNQFRFRALPWGVTFLLGTYMLLQIAAVYSSPCALLGTSSPVSKSQINKAYRTVSMCTHPDRLTGMGELAQKDGELLFTRVSKAKDELTGYLQGRGPSRNCEEHSNCQPMRGRIDAEEFSQKCLLPQSKVFKKGNPKKLLTELCPCSCKEVEVSDTASCYAESLEAQVYDFVTLELPNLLMDTAGQDWYDTFYGTLGYLKDYFVSIVTLEHGPMASISSCLMLSMMWRFLLRPIIKFFGSGDIFKAFLSVPTSVIFAPLPTAYRLFIGPFIRWEVFARTELQRSDPKLLKRLVRRHFQQSSDAGDAAVSTAGREKADATPEDAQTEVAAREAGPSSGLAGAVAPQLRKRRAKKQTTEQLQKTKDDVLIGRGIGGGKSGAVNQDEESEIDARSVPGKLREWIELTPPRITQEQLDYEKSRGQKIPTTYAGWRGLGASAIKFDFVLTLTKNVLPLIMVVTTGQVFNGLVVSMVIGWIIRNKVPEMSAETLHFWLLIAGYFHTVLGMKGTHIEESAELGATSITLEWQWSWKDVLALANVVQLGASFTATSQLGNEPCFATTFGAGVALRYYSHRWTTGLLDFAPLAAAIGTVSAQLPASIEFAMLDEVATSASAGIGDCGGGPFRMLVGDHAALLVGAMRLFLLALPLLNATQWCLRVGRELTKRLRSDAGQTKKRKKSGSIRLGMRFVVASATVLQCGFIATHRFNGIQGDLAGFWMATLWAIVWESLMSTYDLRGSGRQLLYLILFILL